MLVTGERGALGEVDVVVGDATDPARVGAAIENCDAVLHAASVYALAQRRAAEIRARRPAAHGGRARRRPAGPYAKSKAASEAIARRLQDQGAPVVITHPGAVWGLVAMDRSFQPTNAILFELLNGTDGLDKDHDTLFVLTTNRAELLEPALAARPGRIDQAVELVSPDPGGRRRLLAPSCARPRAT